MSSIYDWSLMAASNANSDDNINWQEGQPPSSVNNSARSMMQRIKELLSDLGGIAPTGGTANILTFTAKSPFNAYLDGIRITLRASNTNTGSATLNVNSVGARPIFIVSPNTGVSPLAAGNITSNGIYEFIYSTALDSNSGGWLLLNPTLSLKPVGSYEIMAAPIVPPGYLYCNGQTVSRTTYSALYNVIGTRWGAGNGSTTFNVPDWRGIFMRGWDDGRGVDSGRSFAAQQAGQNQSHNHTFSGTTGLEGSHRHEFLEANVGAQGAGLGITHSRGTTRISLNAQTSYAGNHTHSFSGTTSSSGGNEARPINNTIYVVIKT